MQIHKKIIFYEQEVQYYRAMHLLASYVQGPQHYSSETLTETGI